MFFLVFSLAKPETRNLRSRAPYDFYKKNRRATGSGLAEFGPSLVCYILFFLIPLVDVGTTLVRYWMAYSIMNTTIHRLSMEDKMSDVATKMKTDQGWQKLVRSCGVEVTGQSLGLHIVSAASQDKIIDVPYPSPVPPNWLPNGKMGPYIYYMNLTVDTKIQPLFQMSLGALAIPGLTEPVPVRFTTASAWENLGRDPDTTQFYMNE